MPPLRGPAHLPARPGRRDPASWTSPPHRRRWSCGTSPEGLVQPAAEDPEVVVEVGPGGRWVAEYYPHDSADELPDGGLRITLRTPDPASLRRLALRLGGDGRIVSPVGARATVPGGPPARRGRGRRDRRPGHRTGPGRSTGSTAGEGASAVTTLGPPGPPGPSGGPTGQSGPSGPGMTAASAFAGMRRVLTGRVQGGLPGLPGPLRTRRERPAPGHRRHQPYHLLLASPAPSAGRPCASRRGSGSWSCSPAAGSVTPCGCTSTV